MDPHLAAGGELDGVGEEVQKHLAQTRAVAEQGAFQAVCLERQGHAAILRLAGQQGERGFGQPPGVKRVDLGFDRAGFQLGKIQDVVDDPEQGLAGVADQLDVASVAGA